MFVGLIGFVIGRIISIIFSLLFQRQFSLNVKNAHTLIVLGSGGELENLADLATIQRYILCIISFRSHNGNARNSQKTQN